MPTPLKSLHLLLSLTHIVVVGEKLGSGLSNLLNCYRTSKFSQEPQICRHICLVSRALRTLPEFENVAPDDRDLRLYLPNFSNNSHVEWRKSVESHGLGGETLGEFCFTMIGRADIEGSKSDVATNAWPPQASYPFGNFSGTSCFKS